jgi:hypothetical protein
MVPSTGGLASWVKSIKLHEPSKTEVKTLKNSVDLTVARPTVLGDDAKDEDPDHPLVEATTLCFIPKAWAAYFLDQCSPYEAYMRYKMLVATIPPNHQGAFRFMEAWMKVACLQVSTTSNNFLMTAKWQAPVIDRKVNTWMERYTGALNQAGGGNAAASTLDPQTCFDKAMETIAALKPTMELKKYSIAELQQL